MPDNSENQNLLQMLVEGGRQATAAIPNYAFPNIMKYLREPTAPPQVTPNAAGKVPPANYNPNLLPAVGDAVNLGISAIPAGRAISGAAELAPQAARIAGEIPQIPAKAALPFGAAVGSIPSPAEAAAVGPGQRPMIGADEKNEVDRLNREISALSAQRSKATKDLGPKGAAIQAKNFDDQIAARNAQISTIMGQVANRQNAYDERLADYEKAGQPFSVREGDLVNRIRAGALGASAGTGLLRGAKRMGLAGSMLGGGIEGAAGVLFPSAVDITKPEDTAAYKTTQQNLFENPDYWKRVVAPDTAYGALLGAAGHGIGHAIGGPIGKVSSKVPALALSSQRPAPPTPGTKELFKSDAGTYHVKGEGRFASKGEIAQYEKDQQMLNALKKK